jgi:signal transduction histidine kinase
VVEALGGTIRMRSREGEGTRVEIDLSTNAGLTPA